MAKSPSWNAERIAMARGLKAQGLTAKQAAHVLNRSFAEMPTLTRNAVIAKWDRLGLGKPHIISAKQIEAKVVAARAKARAATPPKPAPKPIAPRLRADPARAIQNLSAGPYPQRRVHCAWRGAGHSQTLGARDRLSLRSRKQGEGYPWPSRRPGTLSASPWRADSKPKG